MDEYVKKIHIDQLRPGMYIADLDCGWMSHPFWLTRFKVKEEAQISQLRDAGIVEFYIDTQKGIDVFDAQSVNEVNLSLDKEILNILAEKPSHAATADLGSELPRAKAILERAHETIHTVLLDAKLGRKLNLSPVRDAAMQLTESVCRNADALNILTRIKEKDSYIFHHSISVGVLLMLLQHDAGVSDDEVIDAGIGGMLHDIGKVYIDPNILNKPGKLTDLEFAEMRKHVGYGVSALKSYQELSYDVILPALEHHERYDGTGYPFQKKGDQISILGQKAAIIDVYDALTSERCYHKGMPPPMAIRKMFEWSKHHFNPQIVREFVRSIGIYPVGTLVSLESGKLAVVSEHNADDLTSPKVVAFFHASKKIHIQPHEIDLARHFGFGGGDRIIRPEDERSWGVDPQYYLQQWLGFI
ncbi:MAG: HD-GYP domain-containing protein [Aquitalea sp.]|nr:HD-GYP domain-containing protein [Aquitalea sp.]